METLATCLMFSLVYMLLILQQTTLIRTQDSGTCADVSFITDIDRDRLWEMAAEFKSAFEPFRNVPIDLVIVLESSGSLGPAFFDCQVQFVKQLSTLLSVSYNQTRISIVVYSSCDIIHTFVDYIGEPVSKNKCSFKDDIQKVKYMQGGTCTGDGLRRAESILKSSSRRPAHK